MHSHTMAAPSKGSALEPWTYEIPAVGPYDCVIRVLSCGICHSDIHMIDNDWGMSSFPLVPGHEVVGEVVEVGPRAAHLRKGQRVGVGWQRSSCLQCQDCFRGNENLCDRSAGVISDGHGGFADHLHMDSRFCFPLPEGIATNHAGPLLCGGVTVYSALRSAGMGSGQEVGVIGVGGLGHMAVQFAAKLGNRVTVFTTSPDKADEAARFGAHDAIVLQGDVPPGKPTRPLNLILNTVPRNLDWGAYIEMLDSDGTLAFVGVPLDPAPIPLFPLLLKRRRIMGSPIGGRAVMTEMLRIADRFGVEPLVETYPLSEANKAIERVRINAVRYRAVLKIE